jgi:lia operon protein LiaG
LGAHDMVLTDTRTISAANIDTISIKYFSDDITLYASETDEVVIKEYKNYTPKSNQATKVTTGDNKIMIAGDKWCNLFSGLLLQKSRVEIYLPIDYAGALLVSVSSGDINSELILSLATFTASCSSGDIVLNGIIAENISMSASSGDIVLNEITAKSISLSASSGDLTLQKATGQLKADVTSGDIRISAFTGAGKIHASSGNLNLGLLQLTGDIKLGTSSGDVELNIPDTVGFYFEVKASSGDIETYFDDKLTYEKRKKHATGEIGDNARYNLQVKVTSGDVKVDR